MEGQGDLFKDGKNTHVIVATSTADQKSAQTVFFGTMTGEGENKKFVANGKIDLTKQPPAVENFYEPIEIKMRNGKEANLPDYHKLDEHAKYSKPLAINDLPKEARDALQAVADNSLRFDSVDVGTKSGEGAKYVAANKPPVEKGGIAG